MTAPYTQAPSKSPTSELWTVTEFQKRRHQTWRAIRLWLLLGVAGLISFWIPMWINPATACTHTWFGSSRCALSGSDMPLWQLNLNFGSMIAVGVTVVAITRAVLRYYRCPKYEALPFGSTIFGTPWGIILNPLFCSKCGAKLH